MVKREKEKQYLSAREQRELSLTRSGSSRVAPRSTVQRVLPFSHCALTLTPYEDPVCNQQGIIFDNEALISFLLQFKVDPVSGLPMCSRDVIRLHMSKDDDGCWMCPILTKPFSDRSKIIAILEPGTGDREAYVYSYDAYNELVLKPKNYQDLTTGFSFHPQKDVMTLWDPSSDDINQQRDIHNFYHFKNMRELEKSNETSSTNVRQSVTSARIMSELAQSKKGNPTIKQMNRIGEVPTAKRRKHEVIGDDQHHVLR